MKNNSLFVSVYSEIDYDGQVPRAAQCLGGG
jgi:hypothetical protein